jgi:hypothetical protein
MHRKVEVRVPYRYHERNMLNRRKFLALSAAAWPAMALGAGKHIPLGVQLYTIRNLIKGDNLLSLLKQIRAIGYEEVELYWNLYKHTEHELTSILHRAGLTAASGHFNYDEFASKIPYARRLGLKWMVCPMLPKAMGQAVPRPRDAFRVSQPQL